MRRPPIPRRSTTLTLAACVGLAVAVVPATDALGKKKDKVEEQAEAPLIDHVALAARLIHDGHYDRAESVLNEANEDDPNLDKPRYYTLKGIIHLKGKRYKPARDAFVRAITHGQDEKVVYLYLGQAQFGLEDYAHSIEALRAAGPAAAKEPGASLIKAQAHWQLKQPAQAIATVASAYRRFKKYDGRDEFLRMQIYYLIELGLYQEVVRLSKSYLARQAAKPDDYIGVGEALRRAKQFDEARVLLESAKLRYPASEKVVVQLAHTYLDEERPLVAAMLFEDAARLDPKYNHEAAELYKEAGRLDRALALNARVLDQSKKLKQRLSVLLQMERYEMIAAMDPQLSRLGLLADENIRYALAYGYFKVGAFAKAEEHLKRITDAALFESAMGLRSAMASCAEAGWEC